MAKRRRLSYSSNEYSASEDDADDAYIEPTSSRRKAVKKKSKVNAKGKAKKVDVVDPDIRDASGSAGEDPDSNLLLSPTTHGVSTHILTQVKPLQKALLDWYSTVHETRGMPWRKPYNASQTPAERSQRAYEVWISEIMLQQTQVATVIPYYNAWMTKFPTIQDLASSDIDTVNGLWKGLGYYSRAARLLSGAQKVVKELNGHLPTNVKDMESKIPGIGRYSAGAICSIAYNQCVPVLDGNVHRLLSRFLTLHAPPKSKQTLDILWSAAESFVQESTKPGDLNQALIELGSTVCKVRDPLCGDCPLKNWCKAYCQSSPSLPSSSKSKSNPTTIPIPIPDIEEEPVCTLCEPLPLSSSSQYESHIEVTSYPMKAERKKAREELDIVNVIEWRSTPRSSSGIVVNRWFLLVKRPNEGLLAGLHEFPTLPSTGTGTTSLSNSEMNEIPHRLLSRILVTPPLPYHPLSLPGSKSHSTQRPIRAGDEEEAQNPNDDSLRIIKIKPAGDVIHIFSHIKKTYRVQWVVLQGEYGQQPPSINIPPSNNIPPGFTSKTRTKGGKKQGKPNPNVGGVNDSEVVPPQEAMWTLIDDVPKANIGTGVLKIWKQVSKLWEDDC
ncbi:DNA glycosylase [Abortiporus biennis]|nr:DNA glycosylase [Abortiporus biennis]